MVNHQTMNFGSVTNGLAHAKVLQYLVLLQAILHAVVQPLQDSSAHLEIRWLCILKADVVPLLDVGKHF